MVNDFNFLSKQAKKEIKKSTDWFVSPFVFSSKLVIFIEKRRSLGSSFSYLSLQKAYFSKMDCLKSSVSRR